MVDNAAQDFAQRFARAYLTYDAARPGRRERMLRPLVPEDFDPGAGVTPRGHQEVLWTPDPSNLEAIAGCRLVVVAAATSTLIGVVGAIGCVAVSVPIFALGQRAIDGKA